LIPYFIPRQRRVWIIFWIIYRNIINEYLKYEYSLIPINSEKKPYIYWKPFQYKKANIENIFDWYDKFTDVNIGIVTGDVSKLAVIDVDDLNLLPELKEFLPEIKETTRVRTRKGYHYYFSVNGEYVKSTNSLFGKRPELKSNGNYVVAPPSIIKAHQYVHEIPLSKILPIPKIFLKKDLSACEHAQAGREPVSNLEDEKQKTFEIPKYHGQKVDCIRQILSRDLQEGERNNSLFILYNLLLRNKNTKEYSKKLVIKKNRSLSKPLTDREVENIFKKSYKYGCSSIEEKLPFINCDNCKFKFKEDRLKAGNILVRNLSKIKHISNTERGIACLLGTVFDGEVVTISEIATYANMNYRIVKKAVEGLQEWGFKVNLKN